MSQFYYSFAETLWKCHNMAARHGNIEQDKRWRTERSRQDTSSKDQDWPASVNLWDDASFPDCLAGFVPRSHRFCRRAFHEEEEYQLVHQMADGSKIGFKIRNTPKRARKIFQPAVPSHACYMQELPPCFSILTNSSGSKFRPPLTALCLGATSGMVRLPHIPCGHGLFSSLSIGPRPRPFPSLFN